MGWLSIIKKVFSWLDSHLSTVIIALGALFCLLWLQARQEIRKLEAQVKTANEYAKLQADEKLAVAKQLADISDQKSKLLAQNSDLNLSLKNITDELDKLKVKYQVVSTEHASTGPIVIKMPDNRPDAKPVLCSECMLKAGDTVSIEVGQFVLKTEAGNYVVAGAAWVEKDGVQLFGKPFDSQRIDVSVLKSGVQPVESRSKWSLGLTAIATTATKPMFGPSATLHFWGDRLELTGGVGLGADAGYALGSLHYRW